MIMRQVTIMDTRSEYREPPEVRHRIRRNYFTGTVDEGALFDIEVGPEGITFPFVMRYRGEADKLPGKLASVLNAWCDGKVFLGGSGSTGKGRFKLELEYVFEWKLDKETIDSYIEKQGLRNKGFKIADSLGDAINNRINGLKEISLPSITEGFTPRWHCVEYRITIKSPLHTADPIEALLDEGDYDSVVYKKRVIRHGGVCRLPVFKGESIRGLVRTAVARILRTEDIKFDEEHEDCTCHLCQIFGNEHQAGRTRFEDLTVKEYSQEKKFDHVSIDRFTSGAAEKKKFDDLSLEGSPENPIVLEGRLWLRDDIGKDNIGKLKQAFCDIRDGLYPLGSRGGIGYGWVSGIEITSSEIEGFEIEPVPEVQELHPADTNKDFEHPPLPELKLSEDAVYYPHYFIKPHSVVNREIKPVGHERFHKGKLTGRIKCTLKTLTPLIIPDTKNSNAFDLQKEHPGHQNFKFFRINDKPMIPGSELRGMISSVYETLTNSCFRVFEEERYLTRREKPKGKKKTQGRARLFPGRVIEKHGKLYIKEMEECRLPLYDNSSNTQAIEYKKNYHKKVKSTNDRIAEVAENNINYLKNHLSDYNKALRGEIPLTAKIELANPENPNDYIAILTVENNKENVKTGFIKFTGPNMINQKKSSQSDNYNPSWDPWNLNIQHNNSIIRASLKKKYPRPVLQCVKDGKEYTVVKRAERFFYEGEDGKEYEVPVDVERQYNAIIEDYRANYGRVWEKFTTAYSLPNKKLSHGDLVYFAKGRDDKAIAIVPVRVSRLPDPQPLAKRLLPDALRPCVRVLLEEVDRDTLARLPDRMLFRRHPEGLCPACRLFGTTGYKGRVRFGFPKLKGTVKWLNDGNPITLPLLEKPRPTWSMPDDRAEVPGRKFYVHHHGWKASVLHKQTEIKKTENNRTVEVLDKGNEFEFEVFFENLEDWELGLLIYSLELEPDLAHKLGMAKAFGFGSVKIDIKNILLRVDSNKWEDAIHCKNYYLKKGLTQLRNWFKKESWEEVEHIKDLRCLLRYDGISDDLKVRYPELKDDPEGFDSYEDLKEKWVNDRSILTSPWKEWYQRGG